MDADDLLHPERLRRQTEYLDANPGVDLMDTAACTIDENSQPLGIRGDRPLNTNPSRVLKQGLLIHPAVMGRTSWFRANRYDARFVRAEDHELWVRTCRHTMFGRLQEPLLFYRESLSGNLRSYLATARTIRKIVRRYGPAAVGSIGTELLVVRSYAKGFFYWTYTRMGWQGRLIRARTRPLEAVEAAAAREAIHTVLHTSLPTSDRADHEQVPAGESPSPARLHGSADAGLPCPASGLRAGPGL
jgi:hypothetical protein